jgi:hypothetical protein
MAVLPLCPEHHVPPRRVKAIDVRIYLILQSARSVAKPPAARKPGEIAEAGNAQNTVRMEHSPMPDVVLLHAAIGEFAMKLSATSLTLALLLPSAAFAQVTDLTAGAQNQTRGAVSATSSQTVPGVPDPRTDLDSRLDTDLQSQIETDLDSSLEVDDSLGAQADADLTTQARLRENLNTSLTAYDRSNANARLATALEQRTQMYAHTNASASASVDRPQSPDVNMRSDDDEGYAYIVVYSRDGYRIGSVTRYDQQTENRVYFNRADIDAPSGEVAMPQSSARFDASAQAIILDATRADIAGMTSVG